MIETNKKVIFCIQNAIDKMLEKQNTYAVDRELLYELNDCFDDEFDCEFTSNYLDFISLFSNFFDTLIKKLEECEKDLLDNKELGDEYYFVFNFEEFENKSILLPYKDLLKYLDKMFGKNITLKGIVFYMHLNSLLKKYMFINNKIRIIENIPVFDIEYSSRIDYYKEKYITNFRHELEEGIRTGVFLDDGSIY